MAGTGAEIRNMAAMWAGYAKAYTFLSAWCPKALFLPSFKKDHTEPHTGNIITNKAG